MTEKIKNSLVKEENYYVIQGWMIKNLKLSGIEKDVYAIIYGFSQDPDNWFTGTSRYLADWTNADKKTILRILKKLTDKELILKKEINNNGVTFCNYKVNYDKIEEAKNQSISPVVTNYHQVGDKLSPGGGNKMSPIYYNKYNIENNDNGMVQKNEKDDTKKLNMSTELNEPTIPYHDLKLTASFLEKLQTEQPKYFLPMSKWIVYKLEREHNFSNVQNIQFELDSMMEIVKETGLDPDYLVDWNISKNYLKLFKPEKKENNSVISENNQVKREEIDEYDIKNMPKIKEEDEIIRRLKERIYKNFGYYIYSAWFSDIIFDRHNLQHKQRLIIRCGNQFILDKIEKNYLKDIVYPGNIIKLGLESLVKEIFKENEKDNEEIEIIFTKDKEV